jgi:hypothetical protein
MSAKPHLVRISAACTTVLVGLNECDTPSCPSFLPGLDGMLLPLSQQFFVASLLSFLCFFPKSELEDGGESGFSQYASLSFSSRFSAASAK